MRSTFSICIFIALFFSVFEDGYCQTAWYNRWGLLQEKTLDMIINEASGEKAFNAVFDLSEPFRKRSSEEFTNALFESQYILKKLNEYGLSEVKLERFGKTMSRQPLTGLLSETSPGRDKIADINDLPFILGLGSLTSESEGELVYIGDAFNGDLDKMDLTGKVVLTGARAGGLLNTMVQKGVKGIVSYYSPRPLKDPVMVPDPKGGYSRGGQQDVFVFNISPREGMILRSRLLDGEKITVKANIRFRNEELDIQVPSCVIPGTDPGAGEIIFSAHLFEGYGNQGANDNVSGAAAILETARTLQKLIADGKIPRPRRTIRFIWVPEFSGTIPWVNAHRDIILKSLCNINLDMVGLSLSKNKSYFVLHRTKYGNAHYLNDVMENYYRYVSENNQENSVVSGSKFFKPIVAPTGTDDPFYYLIESSSGGSDHEVFNDWGVGVPGVLMITWPDPFYHTSEDRSDKIDPTQLKRVCFITASAAYTIASAGENDAIAIAGEVYGNSVRRIGYAASMAIDAIHKSGADNLMNVLRVSLSQVKGTALGETMTLESIKELAPDAQGVASIIAGMEKSLNDLSQSAGENILRSAEHIARDFGMPPLVLTQTKEERAASQMIPRPAESRKGLGYDYLDEKTGGLSQDIKSRYPLRGYIDTYEAAALANGKNSILDIKNILDSERQGEAGLQDVVNFFRRLEAAGVMKL